MQAYEGYLDNGRFFPMKTTENIKMTGRHRVIITILDKSVEDEKIENLSREEYLKILDALCGSIDDPTFIEPIEIPLDTKLAVLGSHLNI